MAKQIGIHPISGKFGNAVYYQGEQVGAVMRKTYDALGDRVKTAAEYANTRRNNSEFGMCAHTAGQLIHSMKGVCNLTLKSRSFGDILRYFYANQSSATWGQRQINVDLNFQTLINGLSKNAQKTNFQVVFANQYVTCQPSQYQLYFTQPVTLQSNFCDELLDAGAMGLSYILAVSVLDSPSFTAGSFKDVSIAKFIALTEGTLSFSRGLTAQILANGNRGTVGSKFAKYVNGFYQSMTNLGGVYLFCLPWYSGTSNPSRKQILTELCWHEFACLPTS